MPTYVMLANWTDQGMRSIGDSPKRVDTAKKTLEEMGGQFRSVYMTMGMYDLIMIYDAPDDAVAARFTLMLGKLGNVRTTSLKAFPEEAFRQIVNSLAMIAAISLMRHRDDVTLAAFRRHWLDVHGPLVCGVPRIASLRAGPRHRVAGDERAGRETCASTASRSCGSTTTPIGCARTARRRWPRAMWTRGCSSVPCRG